MTLRTSTYNRRFENGQIVDPTEFDDPVNPIPKYGWSTYTSADGNTQESSPAAGGSDGGTTQPAFSSSTETSDSPPSPSFAPIVEDPITDQEGGEDVSDSSMAAFSTSESGDGGDGDGGETAPSEATTLSSSTSTHDHDTTGSGGGGTVDTSTVDCSINSSCDASPFYLPPFRPSPLVYTQHYDIFGVLDLDTPVYCDLPPAPFGFVWTDEALLACDSLEARIERDVTAFAEHMEQELCGLARVADASDSLTMMVTGTADAVGLDTLTTSDVFGRMGDMGSFSYVLGVATFTAIAEQYNGDLAYAATACDIDVYGADLLLVFNGDSFFTYFGHDAWQTGASSQSYVLAIDFADFDFADGPVVISAEDMQEWIDEFCFLNDFVTGNLSLLETDLVATAENTFIEVDPNILTIEDQLSSTGVSAIMSITT